MGQSNGNQVGGSKKINDGIVANDTRPFSAIEARPKLAAKPSRTNKLKASGLLAGIALAATRVWRK